MLRLKAKMLEVDTCLVELIKSGTVCKSSFANFIYFLN